MPETSRVMSLGASALLVLAFTVMGGTAAYADTGEGVNTTRVLPGPSTAEERAAVAAAENTVGADYVASPNVELVKSLKLAADGVGAHEGPPDL